VIPAVIDVIVLLNIEMLLIAIIMIDITAKMMLGCEEIPEPLDTCKDKAPNTHMMPSEKPSIERITPGPRSNSTNPVTRHPNTNSVIQVSNIIAVIGLR
jgi:hypothetical protein